MKGLKPRAYNILFHTHTISGIVISAVLFVIFFAGAISLYKQEFYQWEDISARFAKKSTVIDYERLIVRMDSITDGVKEAHDIRVKMPTEARPVYTIYALVETDSTAANFATFIYNPNNDVLTEAASGNTSTTGETLYRLHFLDQIPMYIGRYIAGFVSLFFAFAVITGLLIHWKNLVQKFYAFSFKDVKKQFWTNAHTVFGVIGLPFQLMYAVTGAFYMLTLFVLLPTVVVLFKGDDHKLLEQLFPIEAFHSHEEHHEEDEHEDTAITHGSIAHGLQKIQADYPLYDVMSLDVVNFGHDHAVLGAELRRADGFNQHGLVVLDLHTDAYQLQLEPGEKNYVQSILQAVNQLHFGSFGGWIVKSMYFLLSFFSCFVIISGVLIWKEARNKPSYTDKQRKFHRQVTIIYLSICLSLFPASALLFILEQVSINLESRAHTVNLLFFIGWLIFALLSYLMKSEKAITRLNLALGGVFAFLVPVANGWMTGDWFWGTIKDLPYVFATDVVWLTTGVFALLIAWNMGRKKRV